MEKMQTQELISALVDGQLRGEAFALGVEIATCDPVAREAWHTYHLIGDVLRSGDLAVGTTPTDFLERLQSRLRQEQRLAPHQLALAESPRVALQPPPTPAANDGSFRWKLVAGLASVAAVGAIGWAMIGSAGKPEQAQLAVGPGTAVLAGGQPGVMIRDPQLDEFLAAHRQLGGASALQMPAGFLRNATFEGSNR